MVGLYFPTALEVRCVQTICFGQWNMSGSDAYHSQADIAEPVHESPCSLFPLSWWSAAIQIKAAPSLGPRMIRGGAEPQLTYNGPEVWVRSKLCFYKAQNFCGCWLPSHFIGFPGTWFLWKRLCQIATRKDDLTYLDGCTSLIFLSTNSSWNHPFKHPSVNATQNF